MRRVVVAEPGSEADDHPDPARDQADGPERLWAVTGLVILVSILMHGLTVTPIMRLLDRRHGRDPDADEATPPPGFQGPAAD